MELELHRVDLLQSSAAAPGTLLVLPPGENKTQKVAVGDLSGVVQCFSVKKGEVTLSFKTLPSPEKVTAMTLGMSLKQKDKIFYVAGNSIKGITKKGNEFFRFTTSLTEAISELHVADSHIWAGCQYTHNHFIEAADAGLYMSPDKILATELLPLTGTSDWLPVLACRDCCIRVIGKDNKPLFEIATGTQPTSLRYIADVHGPAAGSTTKLRELLYGCQDGRLVQLLLDAQTVRQGFVIPGGSTQEPRAAVTAIHCGADYSKTGVSDIVIGREDGSLEVWDVDGQGVPQLVVSTQLSESITSVGGGYITNAASPDIIVHTFTGKVIAFASQPGALQAAAQQSMKRNISIGRASGQDLVSSLTARMTKEQTELAELRSKLTKERERYAANQHAALSVSQSVVDVRHRLSLQEDCFVLFVEAAVSLFALALQSTVPLILLDLPGNVAILSKSPADLALGNATLATYRCQESTNRLSLKFKAREGSSGKISAYIIPAIPPKTCSVIEVQLPPLCMHQMVSSIPGGGLAEQQDASQPDSLVQQLQQSRPCSELVLQGNFNVHVFHSWLRDVLPDVPTHLPANSSTGSCLFKQSQLGTMLGCWYSDGQAKLVCDSITTLAILQNTLLASATTAKQQVNIRYQLHPQALQHCCGVLWPLLEEQKALARRKQLGGALQELHMQEGDSSFLDREYRDMISTQGGKEGSQDVQDAGDVAQGLDAAVEMFKQLYRDYRRLVSGATVAVKQHLPGLEKLLRGQGPDSSLETVVQYILDTCR